VTRAVLTFTRLVRRLKRPLVTARGSYAAREGFEIQLTTGDGRVGRGEAMPLVEFGTESVAQTREVLERFGRASPGAASTREPSNGQGPDSDASRVLEVPETRDGIAAWLEGLAQVPAARHALELAALDLQAQVAGVPLAAWLADGASWMASVEVNALLGAQAPKDLAEEGRAAVAAGARTLKVKVGVGPLSTDLERLAALRAAVGTLVKLRLDANGAWSPEPALEALGLLAAGGPLELCEQPVPARDVEGLAALRGRAPCALGADESLAVQGQAARIVEARAADVLVLKPMVLGGLLPALALARRGRAAGLDAIVTSAMDGVIARAGATHLAAVLGSQRAHGLWVGPLFEDEPKHAFAPVHGAIALPASAGLGLRT
jgi:o-succinylbenzoate synthase